MTIQPTPVLAQLVTDLDAVAGNIRYLADLAAPAEVMAIIKADGYNHGAEDIARTALASGARQLGVATIGEALALRELGLELDGASAPITAWMWEPATDLSEVFAAGITLGVPSLAHARQVIDRAKTWAGQATAATPSTSAAPVTPPVVGLMVDTGLSRSGVDPKDWAETVELLATAEQEGILRVDGVLTHLASADDAEKPAATDRQAERFQNAIDDCRRAGLAVARNHIANTPATLTRPDLRHEVVRPGVAVYGVDPVDGPDSTRPLKPAMTFRAKIITTRTVPAGEAVSYSGTWVAEHDTRTAVIAAGYADGVPRAASGKMQVGINGRRYQQVGRVCMDQIVVNLGPVGDPAAENVAPGDWAVIFGEGGPSVDELAEAAGTIAYEITTLPRGPRVERVVRSGDNLDLTAQEGTAPAATAEEMRQIGKRLGEQLSAGTVVTLTGPLGAGKTTITQGIAEGMGVKGRVQSPTFTIIRTHKPGASGVRLLHMDAYRLLGEDVVNTVEPGAHLDRDEVLDIMESLDVDADLDDAVLIAEWGRGMVEGLSPRVLDVEITRTLGDEVDEEAAAGEATTREAAEDLFADLVDEDPREVHWSWVRHEQ